MRAVLEEGFNLLEAVNIHQSQILLEQNLHCTAAVLLDMTSSRKAFNELSEKLSRYEIILAQTENALFEWNMKQDTIIFSDTWKRIYKKDVRFYLGGDCNGLRSVITAGKRKD